MASNVIYLPPGVMPTPSVQQPQPGAGPSGIPFDRMFFEHVLAPSVEAFCAQTACDNPVVEVLTVDGQTHFVTGVSGISDSWVALHTADRDHTDPAQIFVPYQTIFRIEIRPHSESRDRRLGFLRDQPKPPIVVEPPAIPTPKAKRSRK
ncbi:MAG: hypothetical protein ACSLFM_11765 [Tepidiformaceae bacterium]